MVAADRFFRRLRSCSDIYWATAALMIACVLRAGGASAAAPANSRPCTSSRSAVVLVLGTATLLLHDKRFIQWKPTVLLGARPRSPSSAAWSSASSRWRGACSKARSTEPLEISHAHLAVHQCRCGSAGSRCSRPAISMSRSNFAESIWVNFKVFGITAAMMLFMIPQVFWLSSKVKARRTGAAQP